MVLWVSPSVSYYITSLVHCKQVSVNFFIYVVNFCFQKILQNPLIFLPECGIILTVSKPRPVGQAVKTLASHAEIMGSIPVRVTKELSERL